MLHFGTFGSGMQHPHGARGDAICRWHRHPRAPLCGEPPFQHNRPAGAAHTSVSVQVVFWAEHRASPGVGPVRPRIPGRNHRPSGAGRLGGVRRRKDAAKARAPARRKQSAAAEARRAAALATRAAKAASREAQAALRVAERAARQARRDEAAEVARAEAQAAQAQNDLWRQGGRGRGRGRPRGSRARM